MDVLPHKTFKNCFPEQFSRTTTKQGLIFLGRCITPRILKQHLFFKCILEIYTDWDSSDPIVIKEQHLIKTDELGFDVSLCPKVENKGVISGHCFFFLSLSLSLLPFSGLILISSREPKTRSKATEIQN